MWPSTSSTSINYRPFEASFDETHPNPFPSPEPPVPPPTSLSLSPPLGGTLSSNNNWSLSPPAEDKGSITVLTSSTITSGDLELNTRRKGFLSNMDDDALISSQPLVPIRARPIESMLKEPRSKRSSEQQSVKILPLVMDQNQNPTTLWTKLRAASVLNGIGWFLPSPRLNNDSTMVARPNIPGHEVILDLSPDSTANVSDENSENMELLVLQHNPVLLALRAYQTHLELWNKKSSLWNPAGAGLPTPTSPDSEKMSTPYSTASGPPPPNSSMGFAQRMAAMPQSHHLGGGGNGWAGSEIFSAAAQLMWNGGFEAKMAEHPGMIKGGLDDGLQQMSLYGQRSNSSASSSPPAVSGPGGGNGNLVVPQPINAASKMGGGQMGGHSHNNANGGGGGGGGGGGTTGRKYQCKMCPQIFGSKADLQMHTQIHMREAKPYKCSQCNKSFANSSYLSQHTRIHLGIKPYRCEICQRKFTQLSHLQQHVRTHTGDKPYRCRHVGCTKAFSQLSNLQSHSRCHQTDKPYKCNSCYKCFTDETALLEHIPKHKESKHLKTHICQYCGKSYTQETYLAKHMQKHSDRPDKRPPILGALGGNPGAGGNPQTPSSQSAQLSSVAAADAAAAAYWQKMDPYNTGHDRVGDYAQSAGLMAHHRDMMDHRHLAVDDLRHGGHGAGQLGGNHLGYGDFKTSSAFSPIQTGMLNSPAGFAMTGGRGYFPEALPFPKHYGQIGIESKSSTTNLQNNFIALSKIGNYQPGSSDLLHSLKEKTGQVSQ